MGIQILKKLAAGLTVSVLSTAAFSAPIVADLEDATNGGGFFATVTIEDNGTDTVEITADIASPINAGLTQGDILGLWFDLSDFSKLSGLASVSNPSVPISGNIVFGDNAVTTKPFPDNNVSLQGTNSGPWDLAVQLGNNGSSLGFIQTVSFDLTILGLDQSQFFDQRVGMQGQSIAGVAGFTSSKLLGDGEGGGDPDPDPNPVPVPGTVLLLGIGLLGLRFMRRAAL